MSRGGQLWAVTNAPASKRWACAVGAPPQGRNAPNPLLPPPLSTLPSARTPVMHVRSTHGYQVQILDARTVVKPANGAGCPPEGTWRRLCYCGCRPSRTTSAWAPPFGNGTDHLTKERILTGDEQTQGVNLAVGTPCQLPSGDKCIPVGAINTAS